MLRWYKNKSSGYVKGTVNGVALLITIHEQLKPPSHPSGVLTASRQRSKKLQIAEVRAVQSAAMLCTRCVRAVQSPRTPCGGVCFEHAQNTRHGFAFVQRVRRRLWKRCGAAFGSSSAPWTRCGRAACTL